MKSSDETRFKIDYRRRTKVTEKDQRLPMINFQKRVIDFGDDEELFKIVAKLIMKRVDLDPDDLDPLLGDHGPDIGAIDLDAIPADSDAGSPADDGPVPAERRRLPLSERWGLRIYRHPDRY